MNDPATARPSPAAAGGTSPADVQDSAELTEPVSTGVVGGAESTPTRRQPRDDGYEPV